jgi:hypothetical protein
MNTSGKDVNERHFEDRKVAYKSIFMAVMFKTQGFPV